MNCGTISIEASRTPCGCDIDNIRGQQGYPYQSDLSGSAPRVGRAFWYDDIEFAGPILEDYFVRRFRVKFNPRLGFAEVRRMMTRIIRAAIHAYETDSWCLYRQNDLTRPENNFIELLWHDGYVDREIGKWNSDKSRSTASRFMATGFLKGIFGGQTNVRKIAPRKSCIQLRDATGEVIKANPPGEMNSELGTLNKLTRAAKIACDGVEYTGLQYRRVFNRDWSHGGRFYCEFSQLPKASRSKMLIDGEGTTELDFSSMHIYLAYAMVGEKFSGVDAYAVEGFTREEMKVASLICLNGGDARAVRSHWHTASLAASRSRELATYIYRSKAAVEAFRTAHAPIAKIWEIPNIGLKLQYQDSCVMAECMRRLCELNIVPVSLHDSIRVQNRHADTVESIMREASFAICAVDIPVRRS
ncbi:hypothetical protein [Cupriavidus pauculus]|uniref:Uncharacterized protein n=1 Tax=Cupriavidus pauculus TaxID=82633 RepID=A0A3G8GZ62_9BURK|nr:hypothetical protein [Cupriavidus pauculus]AZG13240.1 hypothetical protein EHF44_07175 [Cupriavidus pauculus]